MSCIEVYVYRIRPDALDRFHSLKEQLISEAHTLPGLIASTTLASDDDPHLFIDQMQWETAEHAQRGAALFQELPSSKTFMSLMAGPPEVGGRFHQEVGDRIVAAA